MLKFILITVKGKILFEVSSKMINFPSTGRIQNRLHRDVVPESRAYTAESVD